MKSLIKLLLQFSKDNPFPKQTRSWVKGREGEIYVRLTERFFNNKRISCFDLANIELREKYRNKGIFTAIVESLHHCDREILYIESVSSLWFQKSLVNRGWIPQYEDIAGKNIINSYWKKTSKYE